VVETAASRVSAGLEAAAVRDWAQTYELLAAADAEGSLGGAELEVLAEAALWTGRMDEAVPLLERAYAAYADAGNGLRAGFMATRLAHEHTTLLQPSVAQGWMGRASRHLDEVPDAAEHGYLALERSLRAVGSGDLDDALAQAKRAEELGREHGDRNLEVRGLQRRGAVLITRGDVAEGKLLIDEASAAAVAGELDPFTTVVVYCNTIGACRDVADFDRAGEWTELAHEFCTSNSLSAFPGLCRVNYAEVMRFKGRLGEADEHAGKACEELRVWSPRVAGAAFYELGEIRLRLGDLDAAEEAFREADDFGQSTEPGLSLLRLARGNANGAWASIRRTLGDPSLTLPARARLLGPAVEIALAVGEVEKAARYAAELAECATSFETSAVRAEAAFSRGRVELEGGDTARAFASFREARRLWDATGATYDVARAREQLGRTARRDGDEETATWELQAAAVRFERIGATRDADRVADLLHRGGERTVTRTFVFTDIAKSTEILETIGDRNWANALRRHDDTLRAIFTDYDGQVVDHTGDGFFVAFEEVEKALAAAVVVQRAVDQEFVFDVRIGIHTDGALQRGESFRGRGVHTAARVGAAAQGREILVTAASVGSNGSFAHGEPRAVDLKGLREPVEVVSIDWE
jgi:class 3 adenylate cyclase